MPELLRVTVLDRDRADGSCIQTVPTRGYRFVVPVASIVTEGIGNIRPAIRRHPGYRSLEPARRFALRATVITSAGAVLLVLTMIAAGRQFWHSTGTAPPRLSLVVLPFDNLSGDSSEDYLVQAITDDLTTDLSRLQQAFVRVAISLNLQTVHFVHNPHAFHRGDDYGRASLPDMLRRSKPAPRK